MLPSGNGRLIEILHGGKIYKIRGIFTEFIEADNYRMHVELPCGNIFTNIDRHRLADLLLGPDFRSSRGLGRIPNICGVLTRRHHTAYSQFYLGERNEVTPLVQRSCR